MIETNEKRDDLVWVEKYRPARVKDCILPDRIKNYFLGFVKEKDFPNLLLSGPAGTGKTTIAKALLEELGYDFIIMNASSEGRIDDVRNQIRNFASAVSMYGNEKAIILDEADGITNAAQQSLRGIIEEFPKVKFIFTCNFKNKILAPIQSRLSTTDFSYSKKEKKDCMIEMLKRVFDVLDKEGIEYDKKAIGEVVKRFFPDNRKILNELQKYSRGGKIETDVLTATLTDFDGLIGYLKSKDFAAMRQWVANNSDCDPAGLYKDLYDKFFDALQEDSIPQMVLLFGAYQANVANNVPSVEINTTAMLTEMMYNLEFK